MVVFYYGGSWNRGERAQYRFVGEALASRGILTLVADYRLYPEVRYPDFLRDSAAALSYGLDHAADWGGNPDKVYVMGHSAGAYNAAMMALDPRWLAAHGRSPQQLAGWIGLAGPYDFLPLTNLDAMPVFHHQTTLPTPSHSSMYSRVPPAPCCWPPWRTIWSIPSAIPRVLLSAWALLRCRCWSKCTPG